MRIALLSFEYPPDTGHGGIATYVEQAAAMLGSRGHSVAVFAGSRERQGTESGGQFVVHRVRATDCDRFSEAVVSIFLACHQERPFDLVEAPEFQAEYRQVARALPNLPLVVKFHTPTFLIRRLMTEGWRYDQPVWKRRLSRLLNTWGVGVPRAALNDRERVGLAAADALSAPCIAIKNLVAAEWGVRKDEIGVVPLPFAPPVDLLQLGPASGTDVVFLGRVEVRKGVVDLVDALPRVLRRHPSARVTFVGADGEAPDGTSSMSRYLAHRAGVHARALEFLGRVPRSCLGGVFARAAVVVLPSLWENFPLACLEAMSAGRAVVVTRGTGMEEMVEGGKHGVVVPARQPNELARRIVQLLDHPERRAALGSAARQRVLSAYSWDRIGPLQEAQYAQAIEHRALVGSRK